MCESLSACAPKATPSPLLMGSSYPLSQGPSTHPKLWLAAGLFLFCMAENFLAFWGKIGVFLRGYLSNFSSRSSSLGTFLEGSNNSSSTLPSDCTTGLLLEGGRKFCPVKEPKSGPILAAMEGKRRGNSSKRVRQKRRERECD